MIIIVQKWWMIFKSSLSWDSMSLYSRNLMGYNNNDYDNDNLIKITQVCLKSLKWVSCGGDIKCVLRPSWEWDLYILQLTSHRGNKTQQTNTTVTWFHALFSTLLATITDQWYSYWAPNGLMIENYFQVYVTAQIGNWIKYGWVSANTTTTG